MADDNTIIEGTVKFRDGKKWKSRWCVMRKLSPVAGTRSTQMRLPLDLILYVLDPTAIAFARYEYLGIIIYKSTRDCVHLQVYRDSKSRWGGAASKASLSLQEYLGCEAGFTLDKHSNTLALLCRDFTAVLAFETRERLMQWQVKVNGQLGEGRQYLVLVGSQGAASTTTGKRLPAGPARLHLHRRRFALTSGVPPRLLGVWEIAHLRRYGVVEGRFCFEGGSHCGKGEGLHILVSDQATEITRDFDLASKGQLSPRRRSLANKKNAGSPRCNSLKKENLRPFELKTIDQSFSPTDFCLYEDPCIGEAGAISPYWPSAERTNFQDFGFGDTASVNETVDGTELTPWNGNGNIMLERCMSCISKLGALSRSSTAALTPGAKHFNPAWTMESVNESFHEFGTNCNSQDSDIVNSVNKTEDICRCSLELPPERPPKPSRLDLNLTKPSPLPLPIRSFSHAHLSSIGEDISTNLGPYENYDVPKIPSSEVEGEYYDTPKRLKECMTNELFRVTKNSNPSTLILKKPCGCLLKFGKKTKPPTIIDTDENFQQASCPCQKVTDWANNWIKLPYCKNNSDKNENRLPNKENEKPIASDENALYATIDLSRKTKRKGVHKVHPHGNLMSRSLDSSTIEIDEGPLANYENLNFALSLEHYENAKDLLKKAGVTQFELNALSANLRPMISPKASHCRNLCTKCGHPQQESNLKYNKKFSIDEYLLMEPKSVENNRFNQGKTLTSGYTPMSPIGSFAFHTLKYPAKNPINKLLEEKSASNPTLCRTEDSGILVPLTSEVVEIRGVHDRPDYRKRSSSADSSRFLEDVKEFDGSIGSHGSASSIETLRDLGNVRESSTPCDCATSKHSDADSSEASKAKGCITVMAGGNRDSSSSNDSGVSSWSLRNEPAPGAGEFELPATSAAARRRYRTARRANVSPRTVPRRSRSSGPVRTSPPTTYKCCSAEAEVPVLTIKPLRGGVADTHSTSSGASDMSDYIETLSICSSHSSSDTPLTMRAMRHTTSTLRPRSGSEYRPLVQPHRYSNRP